MKMLVAMMSSFLPLGCASPGPASSGPTPAPKTNPAVYFDNTGYDDVLAGGVKMIPIDTMNPDFMEWMAGQLLRGRYLFCPNGSYLALYDDQAVYFAGLVDFIHDVDAGRF